MGKYSKTKEEIREEKRAIKKEKRKKNKKIRLIILILILILIGIAAGIFIKKVKELDGNWLAVLFGHNEETVKNLDKLYVLAMGESTGMSDTIIVCSYDPKTQEASMLSIPRDTFIGENKKKARVGDKINSLYKGGETPQETMEAVNRLTGLNIEKYILIDTESLVELVDTIGGIEFNVPINMKYDDYSQDLHINLKAGVQKLNGDQVEQLVRFRHNSNGSTYSYEYGMEDFGRMRTQREVIIAVAKQTIQFKNITEVGKIVDIAQKYVKTNLDFKLLKDYIPYAVNMNMENIKAEQLPGVPDYLNGIAFFLPDEEETVNIVNELFLGIPEEETQNETELNNVVENSIKQ